MIQAKELKPDKLYFCVYDSPTFKNEQIIKTQGKETIKDGHIKAIIIKNDKYPEDNGKEISFIIKPREYIKTFELSQDEMNIMDILE